MVISASIQALISGEQVAGSKLSRSLLDRLKHNKPVTTVTINDLCSILHCKIEDIAVYIEDD